MEPSVQVRICLELIWRYREITHPPRSASLFRRALRLNANDAN